MSTEAETVFTLDDFLGQLAYLDIPLGASLAECDLAVDAAVACSAAYSLAAASALLEKGAHSLVHSYNKPAAAGFSLRARAARELALGFAGLHDERSFSESFAIPIASTEAEEITRQLDVLALSQAVAALAHGVGALSPKDDEDGCPSSQRRAAVSAGLLTIGCARALAYSLLSRAPISSGQREEIRQRLSAANDAVAVFLPGTFPPPGSVGTIEASSSAHRGGLLQELDLPDLNYDPALLETERAQVGTLRAVLFGRKTTLAARTRALGHSAHSSLDQASCGELLHTIAGVHSPGSCATGSIIIAVAASVAQKPWAYFDHVAGSNLQERVGRVAIELREARAEALRLAVRDAEAHLTALPSRDTWRRKYINFGNRTATASQERVLSHAVTVERLAWDMALLAHEDQLLTTDRAPLAAVLLAESVIRLVAYQISQSDNLQGREQRTDSAFRTARIAARAVTEATRSAP